MPAAVLTSLTNAARETFSQPGSGSGLIPTTVDSRNTSHAARRWALVRDLLAHALELPAEKRNAFLRAECGDDEALRDEVLELVRAAEGTGPLDRPAAAAGDETVSLAGAEQTGLRNGERLGHYRIVAPIGAGGMGAVYKATDENLGRTVALKVISREVITGDDRKRFAREAKAASALNHPNIVTIYEYNSDGGVDYIAMEFVEGRTLGHLLEEGRDSTALLEYARQAGNALRKAHEAGIVHRDLKPGNIMVTPDGQVKVLDFGLAKLVETGKDDETRTALTRVGAVVGTPAYMSPEQALGEEVDSRSDIFSFGVILYEIVCGERPFQGANAVATLRQVVHGEPRAAAERNPGIGAGLSQAIAQCMKKDRDERPATLGPVLAELGGATGTVAPGAAGTIVPGARKWLRGAAVAAAVLAGAGALWVSPVRERLLAPGPATVATPRTAEEWYTLGQRYAERLDRKDNAARAAEAFQKAIELEPGNAGAHAGLAMVELEQAQRSPDATRSRLALEAARKAVELNPHLASGHTALGAHLILLAGRVEEAEAELKRALELDPKSGAAHSYMGVTLEKRGDLAGAEAALRRGVAAGGGSEGKWRTTLALFLQRRGRHGEAAAELEAAVKARPDDSYALLNLGAMYHLLGKEEDAAAALQRSLEISPSARGFSNLGTLLFYLGRYGEATEAFQKAISLDATRYVTWGNLADAYRWTPGGKGKAGEAYREAIRLAREQLAASPKNAGIRSSLAAYLAKTGDPAGAKAELAALPAEAMENAAVLFKAAVIRELGGDRRGALGYTARALAKGYAASEFENDPELMALRKDPEYRQLVARHRK